MAKQVVVVASGETERRALPHLLRHLSAPGIVIEVRMSSNHRALTVEMTRKIIVAAWYEKQASTPPDKFVVLLDADAKEPAAVAAGHEAELLPRLEKQIPVPVLVVAAKWHLEAWFFADPASLRGYLGRDLGAIDTSSPDAIQNPKLHLKSIYPGIYTARIAEEIARMTEPDVVRPRSPSFAKFEKAVRNGPTGS